MSHLLQNLQPWIATTVYSTITFDRNDFCEKKNNDSHIDQTDKSTTSTSDSAFRSSQRAGIIKLNRRPRLAQVIETPRSIPSPSNSLQGRSNKSSENNPANIICGKQQHLMPMMQRLVISDGSCSIPVYVNAQLAKNNKTKSKNNDLDYIRTIQKGAVVRLRNWAVACKSLLFHNIPPTHHLFDPFSPMCLILDERPNQALTNNLRTKTTVTRSINNINCLESMGGEGMGIVGSPLDVHKDVDIRRALSAVFDPVVLVQQVLECHNFYLEYERVDSNNTRRTKYDNSDSENRMEKRHFMTMLGCIDGPNKIGNDVLDNSTTIERVLDTMNSFANGEEGGSFATEQQQEVVDSDHQDRHQQQGQVDNERMEPQCGVEPQNNWEITQDTDSSTSERGRRVDEDTMINRTNPNVNEGRDQQYLTQASVNQRSNFASIEEMLLSEGDNDEDEKHENIMASSSPSQGVIDHSLTEPSGQFEDEETEDKDKPERNEVVGPVDCDVPGKMSHRAQDDNNEECTQKENISLFSPSQEVEEDEGREEVTINQLETQSSRSMDETNENKDRHGKDTCNYCSKITEKNLENTYETQKPPVYLDEMSSGENQERGKRNKLIPAEYTGPLIVPASKTLDAVVTTHRLNGQCNKTGGKKRSLPDCSNESIIEHDKSSPKQKRRIRKSNDENTVANEEYKNNRDEIVRKDLPYNISRWLKQRNLF